MAESIDDNHIDIIKEAVQRYVDAQLRGEQPNIDEFVKQYPALEHQIRESIQDVQKIESLFDSLVQADESDFEDTVVTSELVSPKVGDFEIVEMIGRGGMGVVYLARDTKLERSVAIKSLPAELADDSAARTRFKREAKLLASLNHPNIAVIHDIIEEEKLGYLILEYVPGDTLDQRITEEPMKLKEACFIGQQIAEALSAAHENGVIHRDLKPGNIKITPEGRVKVLDFGLAKAVGSEPPAKQSTATKPGRIMGTPTYMSPEQACGKSTDQRTDIWSFGCIMYEMLTGHPPFEGQTSANTLARIIEREPDWEQLPHDTPRNIRVLLRRCLEKDPHRRLQHMGDAAIEIRETLNLSATALAVTIPVKLRRIGMIIGAVVIIAASSVAVRYIFKKPSVLPSSEKTNIDILTYKCLGSVKNEDFAVGITYDITTHLVKLDKLNVRIPWSAMRFRQNDKNVEQIDKEFHVDYRLEGIVRLDANSPAIITSRLIKTSDNTLAWSESHGSSLDDLSNIAKRMIQAMDIPLTQSEKRALAYDPTENEEASIYYQRGNVYLARGYDIENNVRNAIQLYERAVILDNQFALAYAKLSHAYAGMHHWFPDKIEDSLDKAKEAAERALKLDSELPEAHWALGFYYYWGHIDYNSAFDHFTIARNSLPNDSQLIAAIGYLQRHQGKFDQALDNIKKAYELEPFSPFLATELGQTLMIMRKYTEAERYCKLAIELCREHPKAYKYLACIYLRQQGNTKEARAILEEALQKVAPKDTEDITFWLVTIDVYEGNYQEALDRLSVESENIDTMNYNKALQYARIYGYMNRNDIAKKYFNSAQKNLETIILKDPNNSWAHGSLGIAYAGLGRKEEAIQMGILGTNLEPMTRNPWRGTFPVWFLAKIYVMVGDYDAAMDQIELLWTVTAPASLSIHILQLDPAWAPLHDHPRFQKLLEAGK